LNAGKRSLALDLKNPRDLETARQLAAQADVVLENFRPGVMDRLGLGAAALRALNPRLVYCSISGYGQQGPNADKAAYAMIVQAQSGFERTLMRYAGDRQQPAPTATFVADLLGGVFAFGAIQTALLQRERTGEGQVIDVALMDCMLNLLVYELQESQFPVSTPRPTYGPVAAQDGDLLVVPITPRNFAALCEVTGLPELRSDPRFASLPGRNANWQAMMKLVERWTRERPVGECLAAFEAAGVPCARYADPADALQDPHLRERGVFQQVPDSAGGFEGVNPPWKMTGSPSHLRGAPPGVGEHAAAVLRDWLAAGGER
jgi:crotonobetainyl-CoA:carnitine CoA-transferase CaiB-like acyl-CoA transferase